jgi:hypothetical protein
VTSPDWLALIEQVPAPTIVIVDPETVQTEVLPEARTTVSPEASVLTDAATGESPKVALPTVENEIVCASFAATTVIVCVRSAAA